MNEDLDPWNKLALQLTGHYRWQTDYARACPVCGAKPYTQCSPGQIHYGRTNAYTEERSGANTDVERVATYLYEDDGGDVPLWTQIHISHREKFRNDARILLEGPLVALLTSIIERSGGQPDGQGNDPWHPVQGQS